MRVLKPSVISIALALGFHAQSWATETKIILPSPPTVLVGSVVYFPVNISAPAPSGGVSITLTSSNYNLLWAPQTITIPAGSTAPAYTPQLWGWADGKVTITASATDMATVSESLTVQPETGVTVTWSGARWEYLTIYGTTGNFQSMGFTLNSPVPLTLNATLFFTDDCNPSNGTDNLNDSDIPTYPGSGIEGFTYHPNVIPSSAIYWFGVPTSNGLCPPGAPCSGCVNYTKSTPGWVNPK